MDIQLNHIDGRWQAAVGGATREVINPATGEVLTEVPAGSARDIDRAVKSARKAQRFTPRRVNTRNNNT